jgi:hypothetical protein
LHIQLGAVYVTVSSTIKRAEDVQQGTFPRAALPDDADHLPFLHPEGQVVKDQQV